MIRPQRQKQKQLQKQVEAMRTGEDNNYVLIEEISGLGKGFFINGHGSYFPNDLGSVTFVESL